VLPRAVGLKRLPVTITWLAGLVLILVFLLPRLGPAWTALAAFGLTAFPLACFVPVLPWRVRIAFGESMEPEALFGAKDESAPLDASYETVVARVQALVRDG
jgi:hypothetical protein